MARRFERGDRILGVKAVHCLPERFGRPGDKPCLHHEAWLDPVKASSSGWRDCTTGHDLHVRVTVVSRPHLGPAQHRHAGDGAAQLGGAEDVEVYVSAGIGSAPRSSHSPVRDSPVELPRRDAVCA